jgi:hypothetical protein
MGRRLRADGADRGVVGFDADCNAATAGGLIGMVEGYTGLPVALTGPATDAYRPLNLQGLPTDETISGIAARIARGWGANAGSLRRYHRWR